MSILDDFLKIFVEDNNASSTANSQEHDTGTFGRREIIVKHNGRLERITLNKYGEIISRRYE